MLVRKAVVRGQSRSKLGKRGVRTDEEGLSFAVDATRGGPWEGKYAGACEESLIATSSITGASAFW